MKILFLTILVYLFYSCSNISKANEFLYKANELEAQERYEEAIFFLSKAIKLNPQLVDAYIDRGVDYAILEDYAQAINNYTQVLSIDSTNVLAYYNRAKNYYRMGYMDSAYIDINKCYTITAYNDVHLDSVTIYLDNPY